MPGQVAPPFADLLGVRSSKGRYYQEYRHSRHDLERTLMAVNALSWVLADAPGDARYLVDSTLPVIAQLLGARAVVLVSEHPALGGSRVSVRSLQPVEPGPVDETWAERLMEHAERARGREPADGAGARRARARLHAARGTPAAQRAGRRLRGRGPQHRSTPPTRRTWPSSAP